MRPLRAITLALLGGLLASGASALVRFDEGRVVVDGVQLLQDAADENAYFYLPKFPRLSTQEDGETLEFLCVKYVGKDRESSGGLFHALVEFTLPPDLVEELEAKLRRKVSGAVLRGPVPLFQAVEDGENGVGSFRVVSATLDDSGEAPAEDGTGGRDGLSRRLITSGRAPVSPGSKAVVAARLSPEGATLLWDSLEAPTSDVSIAISAYFHALVTGYNARVTANVDTVYSHFSDLSNIQDGYSKEELRTITDELVRSGGIEVEVLDASATTGLDTEKMAALLDIVTSKLTELMFDADAGWSRTPEEEEPISKKLRDRQEPSGLGKFFFGGGNQPYHTDNLYMLKQRSDIQRSSFSVNLKASTTIKVPVETAGNLGGLHRRFGSDDRYFRIVNLDDPVFEKRAVHFQIDGNYVDSFQDTINFVSVNFRKRYPDRAPFTRSLVFTEEDVKNGRTMKPIEYARLGDDSAEWRAFEYQVRWSVRDRETVGVPESEDEWIRTEDPAVSLVPPFEKRSIEIDADRSLFGARGIASAVVEFATPIRGRPKLLRKAVLRPDDPESTNLVSIYHDRKSAVGWRVTWHSRAGPQRSDATGLDSEYLYLVPPLPLKKGETGTDASDDASNGGE